MKNQSDRPMPETIARHSTLPPTPKKRATAEVLPKYKKTREKNRAKREELRQLVGGRTDAEIMANAARILKDAGRPDDPVQSFLGLLTAFASLLTAAPGETISTAELWNRFVSLARHTGDQGAPFFTRQDTAFNYRHAFDWFLAGVVHRLMEQVQSLPKAARAILIYENKRTKKVALMARLNNGDVVPSDHPIALPPPMTVLPGVAGAAGSVVTEMTFLNCSTIEPTDEFKSSFRSLALTPAMADACRAYRERERKKRC